MFRHCRGRRLSCIPLALLAALMLIGCSRAAQQATEKPLSPSIIYPTPPPPSSPGCPYYARCFDIQAGFDWYEYQGRASYPNKSTNCGPAAVASIIRYASGGHMPVTSEEARSHTGARNGALIFGSQLIKSLDYYGVRYTLLSTFDELKSAVLDRHHPVIALVRMSKLEYGGDFGPVNFVNSNGKCPPGYHCVGTTTKKGNVTTFLTYSPDPDAGYFGGRYNPYSGGHWLVVKGIVWRFGSRVVTYDPDVFDGDAVYWYSNGQPKGLDRLYTLTNFEKAFDDINNFNLPLGEYSAIEILNEPGSLTASSLPGEAHLARTLESPPLQALDNNITFLYDRNIPPGSSVAPGEVFAKTWHIRNSGSAEFQDAYRLIQVDGIPMAQTSEVILSEDLVQSEEADISTLIVAPEILGTYTANFRMVDPDGAPFGDLLPLKITVNGSSTRPDPGAQATFASSTVLVFDTSSSMEEPDTSGLTKLEAAQQAGSAILDIVEAEIEAQGQDAAAVAVVDFNDIARVDLPLTSQISDARSALVNLYPAGSTAMPDGLQSALDLLNDDESGRRQIVILLSDGLPNIGRGGDHYLDSYTINQQVYDLASQAGRDGICVYTVGFGLPTSTDSYYGAGSIDETFLSQIASASICGIYYNAQNASQLANVYTQLRHASTGAVLYQMEGEIAQGERLDIASVTVPPDQTQMVLTLNWPGSRLDAILVDPAGSLVADGYLGATIQRTDMVVSIIVENPHPGAWHIGVESIDVPEEITSFQMVLSARTGAATPSAISAMPVVLIVSGLTISGLAVVCLFLVAAFAWAAGGTVRRKLR